MNSKIILLVILIACFTATNIVAQNDKIEANKPLPSEYIAKADKIYLNREIGTITPGMQVVAKPYCVGPVLRSMIRKNADIKEGEIAKTKALANDSATLVNTVREVYLKELTKAGIKTEQSDTEYTLNIKIFDHGFTWATSSKAGVFLRIKAELLSAEGNVIWDQIYMMEKNEAKQLHNQGAINLNKSIDKLLSDYEKDTGLLKRTYEQICNMLVVKLFPLKK